MEDRYELELDAGYYKTKITVVLKISKYKTGAIRIRLFDLKNQQIDEITKELEDDIYNNNISAKYSYIKNKQYVIDFINRYQFGSAVGILGYEDGIEYPLYRFNLEV